MIRLHVRCSLCEVACYMADSARLSENELVALAVKDGWITRTFHPYGVHVHFCPTCKDGVPPEESQAEKTLKRRKQPIWRSSNAAPTAGRTSKK